MNQIAMKARVTGNVQGVAFRAWTQAMARKLKLTGWVRNEPDGSVLCEAQGPESDLDRFVEELREGPRYAHVTTIDADDIPPPAKREAEFEVTR